MDIFVNSSGVLKFNGKEYKCALGSGGVKQGKKEGDGVTPVGSFPIREVMYRKDQLDEKPKTALPVREIQKDDGWCDEESCKDYNKKVKLPHSGSHEELWRNDRVYDIIVILGYNDSPPEPEKGSAIFMHIARKEFTPTAGCIALTKEDLLEILSQCDESTQLCVKE